MHGPFTLYMMHKNVFQFVEMSESSGSHLHLSNDVSVSGAEELMLCFYLFV